MSDEKNNINNNPVNNKTKSFDSSNNRGFSGKKRFGEKPKEEFEQRILDIARVTRVMKGGKRMSFRACVAIGDKKGRIAVALGKGADVTLAVNKAVNKAKKNIVFVPIVNDTIPHEIKNKFGSAIVLLKPASQGRGVIAGGVVRVIMDLAGVKNISSKILGTNNKVNNAKCTVLALDKLRKVGPMANAKKAEIKKENKEEKIDEKEVIDNK
jgi:small subunit ribosomal protein S5